MPAVLLTPLFETMLDNSGIPLAGGTIETYAAGTLTPLATFTDAAGTTSAANPLVLDSAGRPTNGGVWGSGVYKFILKNSSGVTIGTVDNVTAIFGSGDMTKAVYDAANISQQLVGTAAVQTITNKIFDNTNTINFTTQTKIQSISASVAANALTVSASALTLDFRSTTLGSGTITTVTGTPANLIISSGSTLGTTNAAQSRLAVIAINNAGTIELAVINTAGGSNLSENGLITTTAEGGAGAADSINIAYSTTARSSLAYRVIGYIESTQATAGTWATAPSTIQGFGGNSTWASLGDNPIKAWVNFNGTGTVAIRASFNVSSITDNGTGDYTVNFTNALSDANYAAVITTENISAGAYGSIAVSTAPTTSALRINTFNGAGTGQDPVRVNVIVTR